MKTKSLKMRIHNLLLIVPKNVAIMRELLTELKQVKRELICSRSLPHEPLLLIQMTAFGKD